MTFRYTSYTLTQKGDKMCNVFAVAKSLCKARNWQVSNLELQKMLYIAQVLHLGIYKHHLFRGNFEAWDYGPVIPDIYHRFKMFGNKPVEEWAFPKITGECSEEETQFVESVSNLLSELKAYQLVNLTHRDGSAWAKVYVPGAKNLYISEAAMQKEYEDIWKVKSSNEATN